MVISKDGVKITSYQYPINTCQTLTSVRRRGGFNQTIANPFSTRSLNGKRPNPNPNPALIVTLFSEQILWWMEPLKKRWCLLFKKKNEGNLVLKQEQRFENNSAFWYNKTPLKLCFSFYKIKQDTTNSLCYPSFLASNQNSQKLKCM